MTTEEQHQSAWSAYWASTPGEPAACLPNAPADVAEAFTATWRDFFQSLPMGARVLDIGTGGGAVLQVARAVRRDLRLCGVDYASVLPMLDPDIELRGGVRMESLGFEGQCFDAVVSQFALEYGKVEEAVEELLRVVRPGGAVQILAHHAGSPIIEHNSRRLAALNALLEPQGLFDQMQESVAKGRQASRETRLALSETFIALRREHRGQSIIMDAGMITARQMAMSDAGGQLAQYRARLEAERARLEAMKAAALSQNGAETIAARLRRGCAIQLGALARPADRSPLAWRISSL